MSWKPSEPTWTEALINLLGGVGMLGAGIGWLAIVRKNPDAGFAIYVVIAMILFFSGSMTTNAIRGIGTLLDEAWEARRARDRKAS